MKRIDLILIAFLDLATAKRRFVRKPRFLLSLALALLATPLDACLFRSQKVKQAKLPTSITTASAAQLVNAVNTHCNEIHSFTATVEFDVKNGGPLSGHERSYPSFDGTILERKPESLRVMGYVPVIHSRAFDMATNGETFKLWVPPHNKVFEGKNTATRQSPNPLENFRPNVFADSLLINCIQPDDFVTLTADNVTNFDPKSKELLIVPHYVLTVANRKQNSQELRPMRVIHFNRTDLQLDEEDIYDLKGEVETEATYGKMRSIGNVRFPQTVTIKRPLQEMQIVIIIRSVTLNPKLTDAQFELKPPAEATVEHLD